MSEKKAVEFVAVGNSSVEKGDERLEGLDPRFQAAWSLDDVTDTVVIDSDQKNKILRGLIRDYAENLINAGIMLNGKSFKSDNGSVLRLSRMVARALAVEAGGGNWSQKFATSAGVVVTVTTAAQIQALHDAVVDYAGDVLAASATLQEMPIDDFETSVEWPQRPELVLQC